MALYIILSNIWLGVYPLKVKSSFRDYIYYFEFFVDSAEIVEDEPITKAATVRTSIFTSDKNLMWVGDIRVKWNHTGIYPDARDIAAADVPKVAKRMLLIEVRRYLKPQKDFL